MIFQPWNSFNRETRSIERADTWATCPPPQGCCLTVQPGPARVSPGRSNVSAEWSASFELHSVTSSQNRTFSNFQKNDGVPKSELWDGGGVLTGSSTANRTSWENKDMEDTLKYQQNQTHLSPPGWRGSGRGRPPDAGLSIACLLQQVQDSHICIPARSISWLAEGEGPQVEVTPR